MTETQIINKQPKKSWKFWAGILLAQIILFYLFSRIPAVINLFQDFFEIQKEFHQLAFSWIPFSLGDILYVALTFYVLWLLFKIFRGSDTPFFVNKLLILLNVLYFLYQIFWGMLYFQKPILDIAQRDQNDLEFAKLTAVKYLQKCIETRKQVQEDSNGVFKISDLDIIVKEIIIGNHPTDVKSKDTTTVESIKPSLFRKIMSYTGISGYYNPFTAEAQFNKELPHSQIPFTIGHEAAHQQGYAREQEASFVSYLNLVKSENPEIRYSVEWTVFRSLLNYIAERDPKFVEKITNQYSAGMRRDREAEKEFSKRHQGFLNTFFGFTNNLFLKSNQQEGSVTYSYFVDLLLHYEYKKESR